MGNNTERVSSAEGGKTIFREEYDYWRKLGHAHKVATHRAIDYYRKFTSREVTDNFEVIQETRQDESAIDPSEYVGFNQLVARVVANSSAQESKFVFLMVRMQQLEQYLNLENTNLAVFYCGDSYPDSVQEMAAALGYTCQNSGSSLSTLRLRKKVGKLLSELGHTLGSQ